MAIAFDFGAVSDVGPVRQHNEDSAYCSRKLLAIADGVAGSSAGERASTIAIEALRALTPTAEGNDPREVLLAGVQQASRELAHAVDRDPALAGMATTLTTVLTGRGDERGGEIGLVHIGDSRLYLFNMGRLHPMTRDHSLPQLLVDLGEITPAQAEQHPQRSVIVRSLSAGNSVHADVVLLVAAVGHRFVLCSDGLSDYVPVERMTELATQASPQEAADALLRESLARGSRDNISIIVADVVEGEHLPPTERTLGAAAQRRTDSPAATAATRNGVTLLKAS